MLKDIISSSVPFAALVACALLVGCAEGATSGASPDPLETETDDGGDLLDAAAAATDEGPWWVSPDSGAVAVDAGQGGADAPQTGPDAGEGEPPDGAQAGPDDASPGEPDAWQGEPDAPQGEPDASQGAPDAGTVDAAPAVDAPVETVDSGCPGGAMVRFTATGEEHCMAYGSGAR